MDLFKFLDSNFSQTIIILLTGLVAFAIYIINKHVEKRDAARIILNEIRIAEKAIQDINNHKRISELSIILPNNNWERYKHLFIKKLDQDDFNLINDFYYKCSYAEQYRKLYYDILNNSVMVKAIYMQEKLIDLMMKTIFEQNKNDEYYNENKKQLIEMANKENWLFDSSRPIQNLLEYIHNIIFITPSNAGSLIKKIAKVK